MNRYTVTIQGDESEVDIAIIQTLLKCNPTWGRTKLSEKLCRLWNWRTDTGQRLGVSPPRITALEKSEQSGSATIKTMRQAAEALDCVFVYAVIPRDTFTTAIRNQAESLARNRMNRVSHSMLLEAQQLSRSEQQKAFAAEVEKIMQTMPKELWDKPDEL